MTTMLEVTSEFALVDHATATQLLKNLKVAQAAEAKAKMKVAEAKAAVLLAMNGAEVLVDEETKQELVTHRVVMSQTFDATKFKQAHPAMAVSFLRTQYSRPFRVVA